LDEVNYRNEFSERQRRNGQFESCETRETMGPSRETDSSPTRNVIDCQSKYSQVRGVLLQTGSRWRECVRHAIVATEICTHHLLHRQPAEKRAEWTAP